MEVSRRVFSFIFLVALFLTTEVFSEKAVGLVVSARGESFITNASGEKKLIKKGSRFYPGDVITSGKKAIVKLLFLDKSTFSLAEHTKIKIKEYLYSKNKKSKSVIEVKKGVFEFMAGKIAEEVPENYQIKTETATIGIRGSGGSGQVFDGAGNKPKSLEVMTVDGHVLVVTTKTGKQYVVEEPVYGLKVNEWGNGTYFVSGESLFSLAIKRQYLALAIQPSFFGGSQLPPLQKLPSSNNFNYSKVTWYFRKNESLFKKKKRDIKKVSGGDPLKKLRVNEKLKNDRINEKPFDFSIDVDRPSSKNVMMSFAKKMDLHKNKTNGSQQVNEKEKEHEILENGEKERASSFGLMKQISLEEQKKMKSKEVALGFFKDKNKNKDKDKNDLVG